MSLKQHSFELFLEITTKPLKKFDKIQLSYEPIDYFFEFRGLDYKADYKNGPHMAQGP